MGFFGRAMIGGAIGGMASGDLAGVAAGAAAGAGGGWAASKLGGIKGITRRGIGGILRADEMLGAGTGAIGRGYRKLMSNQGTKEKIASGLMRGQDWIGKNSAITNKVGGAAFLALGSAAAGSIGSSVLRSNRGY